MTTDTITLPEWKTPVTNIPPQTIGTARIGNHTYPGDLYYHLYGVHGAHFFYIPPGHSHTIKNLKLREKDRWRVWMVDDAAHWWAMEEYAERLQGKVLVAGLGLGLIVHALSARQSADQIIVIERNADVIQLISPYLPEDPRIQIIQDDFWSYVEHRNRKEDEFDGMVVDLWQTNGLKETKRVYYNEVLPRHVQLKNKFGNIPIFMHGFGIDKIERNNP